MDLIDIWCGTANLLTALLDRRLKHSSFRALKRIDNAKLVNMHAVAGTQPPSSIIEQGRRKLLKSGGAKSTGRLMGYFILKIKLFIYMLVPTYIITKIQQHTIKYTHPYHFIKTPAYIK